MITAGHNFIPPRARGSDGIGVVGLIAFIACLIILIIVVLWVLAVGKKTAYEIAARHDLTKFVQAQDAYYNDNDRYKGSVEDVISNDPEKPSTFSLGRFTPSEGVVITIISDDPFIVVSRHNKMNAAFEYNFVVGVINKR